MNSVNSIMSKNVASVSSSQSIQEAAQLMSQYNVGSIPVVDNGQMKGIITDRDITLRTTAEGRESSTKVSDVMTSSVVSGRPDMSYEEATQLMAQNQIRRLPIVENNNLVGMVALGDLSVNQLSNETAGSALSSISDQHSREQK
ncbi:CBS domain-containing protein [Bacillus mangrovi]|uniref:CBS domain-containing protein n=1 Tax=Metabacillus mangrovi TaxID=1491830 RepID=A0A7X2S4E7_9BACI|nr:CBS domain-containing protein [Metabacillus mangrovi]MTH53449.1 CBS domain-containing protein [Metabacillus mangrovi]